jgi:hypothetical protein
MTDERGSAAMSETRWIKAGNLYGGSRVIGGDGSVITVWSVAHGARTVRITFNIDGQTKAESRVTCAYDTPFKRAD